jgi:hypothetical protein
MDATQGLLALWMELVVISEKVIFIANGYEARHARSHEKGQTVTPPRNEPSKRYIETVSVRQTIDGEMMDCLHHPVIEHLCDRSNV